nr:MAG TPA: hypothetical protein [Caudoviricetes sp.]
MKIRGTQLTKPQPVEIYADTVYLRSNIERIETGEFTGWEYEETQLSLPAYMTLLQQETALVQDALAELIYGGGTE